LRAPTRNLPGQARNDGKGGSCHCGHRPAISLVKPAMTAKVAAVIAGTDPQSPWSSPAMTAKGVAFDGVEVAQQ